MRKQRYSSIMRVGWPHIDGVEPAMIQPQWDPNKLAKRSVTESEQMHFLEIRESFHISAVCIYGKTGSTQIYSSREVWQELWKVTWQKRSSAPGFGGLSGEGVAVAWEFFD